MTNDLRELKSRFSLATAPVVNGAVDRVDLGGTKPVEEHVAGAST